MPRLEIDAILHGRNLIVDADDDISGADLAGRIGILLNDDEPGMLISCVRQGLIPGGETLAALSIASGDRLIYVKRGDDNAGCKRYICQDEHSP